MTLDNLKEFACDQIKNAKDRLDYTANLISLFYAEYCSAPKAVRDLFDLMNEESRKLAIETVKRDKVDEYYESITKEE